MATAVIMPRQGQSVESCVIGEWFKKVGDDVGEGELLFSYETDKAVFEEAAKVSGKLLAVFFGVGDDVPCLETVAVIGAEGEDISGVAPKVEAEPEQREEAPAEAAAPAAALQTAERARGISPRAKNAAERLRLDPAMAAPTGPNGRVIERDIAALAAESRTGSGLGGKKTGGGAYPGCSRGGIRGRQAHQYPQGNSQVHAPEPKRNGAAHAHRFL